MIDVRALIGERRSMLQERLATLSQRDRSKGEKSALVARYTAAFAVNFTDWIGKTLPWVRHEKAHYALVDNLRCESVEDHVGMLLNFAKCAGAEIPAYEPARDVSDAVWGMRELFKDPSWSGIAGLTVLALLENLSQDFIPFLEQYAKDLGATDLTYTQTHGVADAKHADAFIDALQAELEMHRHLDPTAVTEVVAEAAHRVFSLVNSIFR